jgi:hypothetical protein
VQIPYFQADENVIILPRERGLGRDVSAQRLEVVVMLHRGVLKELKEDTLWERY